MQPHKPDRATSEVDAEYVEPEVSMPPPLDAEPTSRRKPRKTKKSHVEEGWEDKFCTNALDEEEARSLRKAIAESSTLHLIIQFLDYILRAQTAIFEQIHTQRQLPRIIVSMAVLCALLSGVYGFVMGLSSGPLQAISSGLKLPLLFMLTALICIPSLYTFNVLLGQRFRFVQTVALMVTTLGTTAVLLASLAPVAFFFTTTTGSYSFVLLMHVGLMALCGIYGVRYLYRGCRYLAYRMEQRLNNLLLKIWILLYSVVGMQLGWRLRPFVGAPDSPFQLFRSQEEGNFYIAVGATLKNLLDW
ncbi:hypothetical protein KR51_00009180 [Rubidibacter lacunae KORDI 51-2]|uniref:Actin-binding WH2 domain-containing protein n=1 Tax=Rubidibacter lacunae KORDI 51-2 TaxID=582515 RepID=U5DNE9_9CHRO|nr:hypothetical protein [Rubidibacter lacunae]ERN42397.1 hypothetical protein KR51_00009180 [Rubidibacter lacunae KORDI 51-2]